MSDDNNDGRNGEGQNGGGGGRAPLTLKPRPQVNTGTVKQSFSHGRTKTVVVETKRRRPAEGERPAAEARPRPAAPLPQAAAPARPAAQPEARRPGPPGAERTLSEGELAARTRALEIADQRRQAEIARQRADEDVRRREQEAQRAAAAREAAERAPSPQPAAEPAPARSAPEAREPAAPPARPERAAEAPPATVAAPAEPAPPAPREERPWDRLTRQNAPRREERPRPEMTRPEINRPEAPRDAPLRAPAAPRPDAGGGAYARGPRDSAPAPAGRGGFGAPRPGGYPDRPRPDAGSAPRPGGGYGDRPREGAGYGAPRPGGYPDRPRPEGGYPSRGPRPEGGAGGGYGDRGPRPPREGDTVRYSALAPSRPSGPRPSGPRPGGFSRPAAPSAPEFTKTARSAPPRAGERRPMGATDDDDSRRKAGANALKAVSRTKGEPTRRQGRLTIQGVGDEDTAEKMRSLASVRRAREREREKRLGGGAAEQGRSTREVVIPDAITVQDLAQRMAIRAVDVIKTLMRQGTMLKITDVLDADTAELIAGEFGHTVRRVSEADVEEGFLSADDDADAGFPRRPPVVAVMGHVDHGKTSLLDALRSADVAAGEHGGITQHIGAYQVRLPDGERVTFLDTPGHAAFSQMRARGANVTDIVVLVVAADDGVMPQTVEAINHAKAADAPIIVAINKIDKPGADPQRVINDLLQHEIVIEALGGDVQAVEVSATEKMGLDDLIEAILLQAEVMDLRANPDRSAEGVVIEAKLDKGRGPVATILVKRGTLKRGDIVVTGSAYGRVRALVNERGEQVQTAGPSEPIEILGLDEAPSPGDALAVVDDEARARELTDYRERVRREKAAGPVGGASLADMMAKLQGKKVSELALIVKADVQGSAEAITTALEKLSTDEVKARILHSGAGAITESDVLLAKGSGAPILGFNVRASAQARALAEREGVEIRYYAIIYDLIDDIKGVMSGMLSPLLRETFLGNAEVLQVFDISKVGKIAGCRVTEGVVRRGARTRIVREGVVIQEMGTLQTLKRFKDEVPEVVVGQECGIHFANFQDLKEGDLVECFTVETVQRTL